jgi:hypothetical protein
VGSVIKKTEIFGEASVSYQNSKHFGAEGSVS